MGDNTIYTIRTTIGRESIVMSEIESKVKSRGYEIKAMIHPEKLKGYVMIEGKESDIREAIRDLRYIKGLIDKPVNIEEIKQFLETGEKEIEIHKGDIVEIIGGPFKRERGKVTRIGKGEVTVELLEAAVSIPVTVGIDSIRIVEKYEDKGGTETHT
ncbi:MAG: transcription elongation factor Spt5 [Candidatus Aenigmarchaeota archaeon]|nr:transcription elongation factor Spt5 [Candidatus Aenigmarchaeota archaeon]